MDEATFRTTFPEFSDTTRYPSGAVTFWMGLGAKLLPPDRWEDLFDQGLALYTAHHLSMADMDQKAAAAGASPGQIKGPTTAKSVDKVSSSHDTAAVTLDGAGFWNLTSYGVRFLTLARCIGAGGIQL